MNLYELALMVGWDFPLEPRTLGLPNKQYTTTEAPESSSGRPSEPMNAGGPGETKALHLLREYGFNCIQEIDWLAKNDKGEWIVFEIKEKELWEPGSNYPHWGAGLDKSQLYLRTRLLQDKGERTYFLNFVKGKDEVYGAYLDELEAKGEFYDTPNDIRIYPIKNFSKGKQAIKEDLDAR